MTDETKQPEDTTTKEPKSETPASGDVAQEGTGKPEPGPNDDKEPEPA